MNRDTLFLDWLERHQGYALLSDDHDRWAVVTDGLQNIPDEWQFAKPGDVHSTFFVTANEWRGSIREAIDSAMEGGDE